jgi:hypothetical protein
VPGHGDAEPFLRIDDVVVIVGADAELHPLIRPVNRLPAAVWSAPTFVPDSLPTSGSMGGNAVPGSLASWVVSAGAGLSGIGTMMRACRSDVLAITASVCDSIVARSAGNPAPSHHPGGRMSPQSPSRPGDVRVRSGQSATWSRLTA